MSHSLPNPAGWRTAAPGRKTWAHYTHTHTHTHTHTTDTFLFIFHTTNVPLFKFRCNIFIGVRIIKEMPASVASGTPCILQRYYIVVVGRDSSVGIETSYGLYGPGIESQWKARFSAPVQIGPGAHRASYTMGYRVFPGGGGVKLPGVALTTHPF
jgi:hypothetical protein